MICFIIVYLFFFNFSLSFPPSDKNGRRFTSKRTDQSCGNSCHASEVCQNGQCVTLCPAGQVACNGWCSDLSYDINNCGQCGRACHANEVCSSGQCVVNTCPQPNHASDISYGYSLCGSYTQTPDATQCWAWGNFVAHLSTSYSSVKISSSLGGSYTCNNSQIASALASSIKTGTTYTSPPCNGKIWSFCASYCGGSSSEIQVNDVLYFCDQCNNIAAIRPCWCNLNWGGVDTPTCSPPTQDVTIAFQ